MRDDSFGFTSGFHRRTSQRTGLENADGLHNYGQVQNVENRWQELHLGLLMRSGGRQARVDGTRGGGRLLGSSKEKNVMCM